MWISHVPYAGAAGRLKQLYDRVKGPDDNVDNIMLAHSLRPHSMEGHMALYKNVLHHSSNSVPKWFLETLGVYVSLLNGCSYCVEHHYVGLQRLVGDDAVSSRIRAALAASEFDGVFDGPQASALAYACALTTAPSDEMSLKAGIEGMRQAGFDDGAILEVNQVVAYFAYANRTVLGLGVNTKGDVLGLSPGNAQDPGDWSHR
jgi:uncharacterized peroxidase-related enzyme